MKQQGKSMTIAIMLILALLIISGCSMPEDKKVEKDNEPAVERSYELSEAHTVSQEGTGKEVPQPTEVSKKWVIGAAFPMMSNMHCVAQAYGFIDECEEMGVEPILLECGGYGNIDKHINQIQDLIAKPVDAIYLFTASGPASASMVDQAVSSGIPVINVNVMTESENVVTRIRSDDLELGTKQAQAMEKALGGKGKVVCIAGPAGTSWAQGRYEGFAKYIKENCPDIEILDVKFMNNTVEEGTRIMEDFLQTYPDIDGVMCGADGIAIGAGLALEAQRLNGKVVLTTTDTQADTLKMIKNGTITATTAQSPVLLGRYGARAAVLTLEGKADQIKKNYFPPTYTVEKSNIDTIDLTKFAYPPDGWKPPIN